VSAWRRRRNLIAEISTIRSVSPAGSRLPVVNYDWLVRDT